MPQGEEFDTDPAREGTCAAWVAESVLVGQYGDCYEMVGEQHENGWIVDQTMARFIQEYVNHVMQAYGDFRNVEKRISLTEDLGGTPDAFAIWPTNGGWHLSVTDLKYGFEIVEPWGNLQLAIYAGAVARLVPGTVTSIELSIYQPRAYHPHGILRTWKPGVEELTDVLTGVIQAAEVAKQPDALCVAGGHCRYCDAANICSAVAHEAYRAVSTMQNDMRRNLTAAEMSAELDFIELAEKIIKSRKESIRTEAEERIRNGELIQGWTLERAKGRRAWTVDPVTVQLVTGLDPRKEAMVTPAELERMGADPERVKAVTGVPMREPKLTRFNPRGLFNE